MSARRMEWTFERSADPRDVRLARVGETRLTRTLVLRSRWPTMESGRREPMPTNQKGRAGAVGYRKAALHLVASSGGMSESGKGAKKLPLVNPK